MARGRPNWWVILAVSLGLMALLVATAGVPAAHHGLPRQAAARVLVGSASNRATHPPRRASSSVVTTTTVTEATTTTTTTVPATADRVASSLGTPRSPATSSAPPVTAPTATPTTTTAPAATTATTATTGAQSAAPADRTQTQGYLNPPLQTSGRFGFSGTGAMQVSVVWSGDTYLTLEVTCPNIDQNVGGTSAMAASLLDASGSCLATVSEPATESTALTYTIAISPTGG